MNLYQRITALIVIITFGGLVTSPAGAAIRTELEGEDTPVTAPAVTDERERLAQAVVEVRDELRKLAGKPDFMNRVASLQERRDARERLKALRADLRELDRQTREEFRKTRELIDARGLPPVIVERHAQALAEYDARATALFDDLSVIESADETAAIERAQEAAGRLEALELERAHQPFDPNVLPNRSLQPPENNEPKLTPEEFLSAADLDYSMALAANEGFDLSNLADANNAAYLAETPEVVISEAIEAKAAELGHDPIAIYNFVRNNVEWQPYWGAVQNADLTLSAQRGTAMDIASLTIALLRASGIPARYAHGTIELDEDKFRNWIGGFEYIDAAIHFAASGGIPIVGVKSGGETKRVRMQHIWVEAALDYAPSRGAINRAADTWVPMDPSFKQYEFLEGLDPVAIAGLDPEAIASSFLASGTVNEEEGWVSGFDSAVLQSAQETASQALQNYIDTNLPNATVGDVLGGRRIIEEAVPFFAGTLSYQTLVTGARYASLPDSLRQHMVFGLEGGHEVSFRWAEINNERITLSFRPATPVDEQALMALLPEGEITDISQLPDSIPTYLVNLIPELKVGDDVVLTGDRIRPGEEVTFTYTPYLAGGRIGGTNPYKVIAGSYLAVAAIAGNVAPITLDTLRTRVSAARDAIDTELPASLSNLSRERVFGDFFYAGLLSYYGQYVALTAVMDLNSGGHYLGAGLGTFGHEPSVHTVLGYPMSVEGGAAVMNIPILSTFGYDNDGSEFGRQGRVNFILQAGLLSSTLEHVVPEQIFSTHGPRIEAISAARALQKANAQGQKIYHITRENQLEAMPKIHHNVQVMTEIRDSLARGFEVITHSNPVSVPGWSGAGYILIDPVTGDGAYKINGGQNGGIVLVILGTIFMLGGLMPFALLGGAALLFAWLPAILAGLGLFLFGIHLLTADWTLEEWQGFAPFLVRESYLQVASLLRILSHALFRLTITTWMVMGSVLSLVFMMLTLSGDTPREEGSDD